MEPDMFNNILLHLLIVFVPKVSFLLQHPPLLNHPLLQVGGGAEIWKGLLGEVEEERGGGL